MEGSANELIISYTVLTIVFGGALFGIFWTKTKGFGKYTSSTVILTLLLYVAALSYFSGRVEWAPMANLLFAIGGFAGGLVTAKAGDQ